MKLILLSVLFFISNLTFSQIYGDITTDKRPVVNHIDYAIPGYSAGQLVFDIIVDEKGNISSCKLDKAKSTVKSTPTMMKAKNRILMDLKFEASPLYPKFHYGEIVIKVYKKDN